jgi:hypothetical protein
MTGQARRRRVVERDPNAGLRVLLAAATELAEALEQSVRRTVPEDRALPAQPARGFTTPAVDVPGPPGVYDGDPPDTALMEGEVGMDIP